MSVPTIRIGYYFMDFTELDTDERTFDKDLFKRLLVYINGLGGKDRVIKDTKANKAMDIESITMYQKDDIDYAKIIFKSCKFNHSPNYMSSEDGSERKTDKKLNEGEKEITHMLLRIDENEAYAIFEERRSGVSMSNVIKFLNGKFIGLNMQENTNDNRQIEEGIIPSEDFFTLINKSERIMAAELIVDKALLGSGFMNMIDLDGASRDDIVITIKAKPREGLPRRTFRTFAEKIVATETRAKRMRMYAKDENNMNTIIDTNMVKRIEEITVDLKKDGTVNSDSIFNKMEGLLEEAI